MFCLAAQRLNVKILFLFSPMMTVLMTALTECLAVVYFLETNVESSGSNSSSAKSGVTVTALENQTMPVSFVV
jgi:hypothetical protein